MFAFHQKVQSSYRARQGKILEKIIMEILKHYVKCDIVPQKASKMRDELKDIFHAKIPNLDVDAMGIMTSDEKAIVIQLRSRDDTGGTTAKASLVDLLKELLRINKTPDYEILYLVCVWDKRQSTQKHSTIKKMYSSLQDVVKLDKRQFFDELSYGIDLKQNIRLKMAYGTDEIMKSFFQWSGSKDERILNSIAEVSKLIEHWDDLWISYAIASIEIGINSLLKQSNIELLNSKCRKLNTTFDYSSYPALVNSIDVMLQDLIPMWNEDSIPFHALSDKVHYIRDLLYLKACYEK